MIHKFKSWINKKQNKLEANLPAPEAQELAALEGANMQTIGDVYDALRSGVDILVKRSEEMI